MLQIAKNYFPKWEKGEEAREKRERYALADKRALESPHPSVTGDMERMMATPLTKGGETDSMNGGSQASQSDQAGVSQENDLQSFASAKRSGGPKRGDNATACKTQGDFVKYGQDVEAIHGKKELCHAWYKYAVRVLYKEMTDREKEQKTELFPQKENNKPDKANFQSRCFLEACAVTDDGGEGGGLLVTEEDLENIENVAQI